jgi:protein-S-isoprenylcysteine O-methyltransferase Ste14
MGKNLSSKKWGNVLWSMLITILGIVCFPANPLVLTGILEVESYLPLFIIGCVVWAFGMVLVMAPIVMFPRRGGVRKGKSFVDTTHLVDTGIYAILRHPQYTGGIYAIFLTTLLWYPHWLFGVLGVIGTAVVYMGCREEDQRLIEKFGDDYVSYMERVPRMNFVLGLVRLLRQRRISKGRQELV